MTNYEKIKNMSVEEMAELLANEAYVIWRSEQSIDVLGKLNATQLRTVKQRYYNYFHELLQSRSKMDEKNGGISMKYKFTAKCAAVRDLKREVDKSLGDIYKTLKGNIDILEDEIDKKDKEIDELNKKIEELKQPKKAVKHQFFDFTDVEFHRVTSDQFIVSADVYISPELYRIFEQVFIYINGNEFYIGKSEVIKGHIKAKVISSSSYDLEEAQRIAEGLLSNDIGVYRAEQIAFTTQMNVNNEQK